MLYAMNLLLGNTTSTVCKRSMALCWQQLYLGWMGVWWKTRLHGWKWRTARMYP